MRTRILSALVLLPLLAGCAEVVATPPAEERAPAVAPTPAPRPAAIAAGALSPTVPAAASVGGPPTAQAVLGAPPPPAEEAAIVEASVEEPAAPAAPGRLGTTIASLGSPTESGLWLETPLVTEPTSGRIEYNGQSVSVQLRPSGGEPGSGSQISVDAMRAIGATLTSLPELVVFAG